MQTTGSFPQLSDGMKRPARKTARKPVPRMTTSFPVGRKVREVARVAGGFAERRAASRKKANGC